MSLALLAFTLCWPSKGTAETTNVNEIAKGLNLRLQTEGVRVLDEIRTLDFGQVSARITVQAASCFLNNEKSHYL